jgi:two-component system cell cycle sensor histidine kinase/response regulator CckA
VSTKRVRKTVDEKFRYFFQENPQPMWIYERESGRLVEVNQAAADMFGYSADELLRMRVSDLRVEDATNAGQSVSGLGARYRTRDGRLLDLETATREIGYEGGRAMLAVLSDVTRRQQLEEQLLQAQKMAAVGMLAGGIAHDFNNLLTIITGYSQLILASLEATDRNHTAAEQIMKAGERAAGLTRQLLAFSRRQAMQSKVLDLNLLVGGLAVMLRRLIGEDIDLRLNLGKELGQVSADPSQIEQVIMNLAVNARDAMPKGGTLTLTTSNVHLGEDYAATHTRVKAGSYVMLAVIDTGIGMDAATRSRLFEPFFTTKQQGQGTGLGLSIVFGIVRQTGGNVEVSSEPGVGTAVKIYLPRVEQAAAAEVENPAAAAERGSETILLVEDEETVRKLVRETLEREGYTVLEASGADQARRISRTHEGPIELMITDVVMPKESGRVLAKRLASVRPDMKVMFMSGYTDAVEIAEGETSAGEFLQKPFTPGALAQAVRQILKKDDGGKCRHAGG